MLYDIVVFVSIIWSTICLASFVYGIIMVVVDRKFRKLLTFQD